MEISKKPLAYRLDRLPVIYPYHRRAVNPLRKGELVYYGPSPEFYGVGEVLDVEDKYALVDFRGTGLLGIHKDTFVRKYLIPIHRLNLGHLLKQR